MKKKIISLLCACMLFVGLFGIAAFAEQNFSFSCETPQSVAVADGADTVKIGVSVQITQAQHGTGMKNLSLYIGPSADSVGKAVLTEQNPGITDTHSYSKSFDASLAVSLLGEELGIFASYDAYPIGDEENITHVEKRAVHNFTVTKEADAFSDIQFTVTPSETVLPQGKKVTFIYQIKNVGNRDITDLNVVPGIGYETLGSQGISASVRTKGILSCKDGENTWTYSETVTVNDTVVIQPTLQYTDHSGSLREKTLDEQRVLLQDLQVEFSLVARPKPSAVYGSEISLIYTVQNTGNVPLKNVTILDEKNVPINNKQETINPGETITGVTSVIVTNDKTYKYTLTALNPQGGEYTSVSNGVQVSLETSVDDLKITLHANADQTNMPAAGEVTFDISVINDSDSAATDIQIVDDTGAVVATIQRLEPGQERIFTWKRTMEASGAVAFRAVVTDGNGGQRVFAAAPVEITVAGTTTMPTVTLPPFETEEPTPSSSQPGGQVSSQGGPWIAILCVVLALIVAAIIALIVINILQKRNAKRKSVMRRKIKR